MAKKDEDTGPIRRCTKCRKDVMDVETKGGRRIVVDANTIQLWLIELENPQSSIYEGRAVHAHSEHACMPR